MTATAHDCRPIRKKNSRLQRRRGEVANVLRPHLQRDMGCGPYRRAGRPHPCRPRRVDGRLHTHRYARSGGQRHWTPHHTCLANNASCRAFSWSALTESTRERRRMKHRPPLPTLRRTPFARGTVTRPANRSRERSLGEVREREQECPPIAPPDQTVDLLRRLVHTDAKTDRPIRGVRTA
jgi:hypothetical protein